MTSTDESRTIRADLIVIGVLLVALLVPSIFTRDLWAPDEPRYMEVARQMRMLQSYILPRLNGEIYSEKPPLFFWLTGLLWSAGVGEKAGRILAGLAATATVLIVYFLCRRTLRGPTPLLAALATTSVAIFAVHARIGVIDPFLTLLVTGSLALGFLATEGLASYPRRCWIAAYAVAGLAVLTKGPVGFLVPALVLLAYGLVNRKRVKAGGAGVHLFGLALFAAIVLSWLVPALIQGGQEYAHIILVKQNLGRTVESYSHRNPFYYFLLRFWPFFLPWSLLVPLAVYAALKQRNDAVNSMPAFAALWLIVYVAFFSCISGKRMGYLLPASPAVGILAGWLISQVWVDRLPWKRATGRLMTLGTGIMAATSVCLLALWAALPALVHKAHVIIVSPWENVGTAPTNWADRLVALLDLEADVVLELRESLKTGWVVGGCVLFLGAAVALVHAARLSGRNMLRSAVLASAGVVGLLVALDLTFLPALNHFKSPRLFCQEIAPYLMNARDLRFFRQDYSGAYNLYTRRLRIPVIMRSEELVDYLSQPGNLIISDLKRLDDVLTPEQLRELTLARRNVGHREMYLIGRTEPIPPR